MLEGNLSNPSDKHREKRKNATTANTASKWVFSSFNRIISERPHATILNLESTILSERKQIAACLSGFDDSTKNITWK